MTKSRIYIFIGMIVLIAFASSGRGAADAARRLDSRSIEELMNTGRDMYRKNMADSAMIMFLAVVDRYDDAMSPQDKENVAMAMNNVGVIYAFQRLDYVKSYSYMYDALDMAEKYGLTKAESVIYINMAELFTIYASNLHSDTYLSKINEYSEKGFLKAYESECYECMGAIVVNHLLFDLGTPTDKYQSIFNDDVPADARNIAYARALIEISRLYAQGRYAEARKMLRESFKLMNSRWSPEAYEVSYLQNLAKIYLAEGNVTQAENNYLRALSAADSLGSTDQRIKVLGSLSRLPVKDADGYRMRYLVEKDSLMSHAGLATIGEFDFMRNLKHEKDKSDQLAKSRHKLIVTLSVVSGVLLVLSLFVFVIVKMNNRLRASYRSLYSLISSQLETDRVLRSSRADSLNDGHGTGEGEPASDKASKNESSKTDLGEQQIKEINDKISRVIEDTDAVLQPDFSLSKLSALINVNTSYISKTINYKYGCSFSVLVNRYRIKEATKRMSDKKYDNMTIEAISASVGFGSRSAFIEAFKKNNGMTPSKYLRLAKEYEKANQNSN